MKVKCCRNLKQDKTVWPYANISWFSDDCSRELKQKISYERHPSNIMTTEVNKIIKGEKNLGEQFKVNSCKYVLQNMINEHHKIFLWVVRMIGKSKYCTKLEKKFSELMFWQELWFTESNPIVYNMWQKYNEWKVYLFRLE